MIVCFLASKSDNKAVASNNYSNRPSRFRNLCPEPRNHRYFRQHNNISILLYEPNMALMSPTNLNFNCTTGSS